VVFFLYRSVTGGTSATSGAAVVDTTAAQASQTAAAATNSQTDNISSLIQGFQQDTETHLATVQANNAAMIASIQDSNAATVKGLADQIAAMQVVQPVAALVPSPMAATTSWANTIASSNVAAANPKTNAQMQDNSKQAPNTSVNYDVVRANLRAGETSAQAATRIYGTT